MQPTRISPVLLRVLAQHAPDLLSEMLTPGKVLDAEVISRYGDKAMLSLGRNLRIEVTVQAPLTEGQRVRVQVQPREQGGQAGESRAPIILKVMGELEPGGTIVYTPGRLQTAAPTAGAAQAHQAGSVHLPAGAVPVQEGAVQPQTQPGQPQVMWLPIPLPQGGQAWAQVHVQEESPRKGRAHKGAVHQVRIFWDTPGLGPIQVSMDTASTALTALFTVAVAESRTTLEEHLPELRQRLQEAGFAETRLGARQQRPGEAMEPVKSDEAGRLDLRV